MAIDGTADLPLWYAPAKLAATAVSTLSGIPGGLFAPSLSVGAGIGSALSPLLTQVPGPAMIMLGMVAYFAGVNPVADYRLRHRDGDDRQSQHGRAADGSRHDRVRYLKDNLPGAALPRAGAPVRHGGARVLITVSGKENGHRGGLMRWPVDPAGAGLVAPLK
jgi:hypothetical protein